MEAIITNASNQAKRVEHLPMFVSINTKAIQIRVEMLRRFDWDTEWVVRIGWAKQSRRGLRRTGLITAADNQSLAGRLKNLLQLGRISLQLALVRQRSMVRRPDKIVCEESSVLITKGVGGSGKRTGIGIIEPQIVIESAKKKQRVAVGRPLMMVSGEDVRRLFLLHALAETGPALIVILQNIP